MSTDATNSSELLPHTDQAEADAETSPMDSVPSDAVPLLDLERQWRLLRAEAAEAIARVCDTGQFVLGPDCVELEREIADYCGARHAVGCASGSDALTLALMALDVGAGDEVVLPSFTFFATAGAVFLRGARPVFVDIKPTTYNLDADRVAEAITPRTRAILPVHLYGQCADMTALAEIAAAHNLPLIEDAAQAIGASLDGRRAGSLGDVACFSFYPTKNLGGCGDGGMLTTDRDDLAESLRLLRVHGEAVRYHHQVVGFNSRLDSIQAAVLRVKLKYLDAWNAARTANAERYDALFRERGLNEFVGLPSEAPRRGHCWNQYVIRIPGQRRDALRAWLTERRVGTQIYYPLPLHLQPCFAALGYTAGSLPETERAADEVLALPNFPELTEAEQAIVVDRIGEYFAVNATGVRRAPPRPKFLTARPSHASANSPAAEPRGER